jgi:hypothetical protein
MPSVKVAHRHEERNARTEIVHNPFGGVNTHLWRNEAYLVGIVPQPMPFLYSSQTGKTSRGS